jgi:hypothetical protein
MPNQGLMEKLMSKLKKLFNRNKAEAVTIPDTAKSDPVPRSKEEINKQYSDVCTQLGHNRVNASLIDKERDNLMRYIESFSNEMKAREDLDAKTAANIQQSPDALAPETTGVDAGA